MTIAAIPANVEDLKPQGVWHYFAGLAATPRPSKKEQRVRAHVRQLAESAGFAFREDNVGNIVIEVPASPGCAQAPIVVLQAHLDMVCEKNADSNHDFDQDPIRLIIENEESTGKLIVRADGTTLGADNGIGVAMAWAAATEPDVVHGPLELLMTIDEEAGMTGAFALEPSFFAGRSLINIDAEEEDSIYIGCAGGADTTLVWDLKRSAVEPVCETLRVTVAGLRGGHSGCDIHENRGNAIKILAVLLAPGAHGELRIADISGGSQRNAIPREASALVSGPAGSAEKLRAAAASLRETASREHKEPDLTITVDAEPKGGAVTALSIEDSRRITCLLTALPNGVLGMHPTVAGLVETSNNLATVKCMATDDDAAVQLEVGTLSRSSSVWWQDMTLRQIAATGRLAGAAVEMGNAYPGWDPNVESPLLAVVRAEYEGLFGEPPNVAAIHAGLECGIIDRRVPGMDMVSIGPTIVGAHSPTERVYVETVQKAWRFLTAVLERLATA